MNATGEAVQFDPKVYLSAADAAAELGVAVNTIHTWIYRKDLRGWKRKGDGMTYVCRADLDALVMRRNELRPLVN